MSFLKRLFSYDYKRLKEVEKLANDIVALESTMQNKSDDELKEMTSIFKERLAKGETLDDIMVEAYAVAREASRRVIGEHPYPVQLMGAIILNDGDIAEMKTGEGKTLTSVKIGRAHV